MAARSAGGMEECWEATSWAAESSLSTVFSLSKRCRACSFSAAYLQHPQVAVMNPPTTAAATTAWLRCYTVGGDWHAGGSQISIITSSRSRSMLAAQGYREQAADPLI